MDTLLSGKSISIADASWASTTHLVILLFSLLQLRPYHHPFYFLHSRGHKHNDP